MDNDPNQTTPTDQSDTNDIDARIAAERYNASQYASYGYDASPGYAYDESLISRITSAIAANRVLLIPLIAVPIIILGSVVGINVANNSKKSNKDTVALKQGEDSVNSSLDTVNINATDQNDNTDTVTTTPNSTSTNQSSQTTNTPSTTPKSNGNTTKSPGTTTPTTPTSPTPTPTPTPVPKAPTPTPTDVCKNISGNQATVPSGRVRDSAGNCVIPAPKASKVLIVVEENHSFREVTSTTMPYAYALTHQYGWATRYTWLNGDSLPNYIAMVAGTTAGTSNDTEPARLTQKTVFRQTIEAGKTAKTYEQGMPQNCYKGKSGAYKYKHNPWVYFKNELSLCNKYDVPFEGNFDRDVAAGNLPNFGMLVPDNNHNAHDVPPKVADDWFKARMATVFNGPDWKAGRLAIIFVFDEPKKNTRDNIYMSVIHPSTKGKGAVGTSLNHYSITRLGAEMIGKGALGNGASANSIVSAFGLKI